MSLNHEVQVAFKRGRLIYVIHKKLFNKKIVLVLNLKLRTFETIKV